jgi:uncharacterized coiled-coil protein SlyX
MSDITREEVEAKLDANESRIAIQIALLNAKLDALIANNNLRFAHLEQALRAMGNEIIGIRSSISGLRTTILVTAISSVIAIVFGVAGFNAVLLSNMVATFESGKNTEEMASEVRRQVEATAELLRQAQSERETKPVPQPPK